MTSHTFTLRNIAIAGLLAATGAFAVAQGTPPAAGAPAATTAERAAPQPRMGEPGAQRGARPDRAEMARKMQEHHARREAELKTRLQLTAQQEGAWTAFTAAMKPTPRAQGPRFDRAEFAQLTTPQRLDRMQQLKAERDARMAKRADATRTFYAQLNPSQQKVFDLETARGHRGHGGHGGPRGGHGPEGHRGPMGRG